MTGALTRNGKAHATTFQTHAQMLTQVLHAMQTCPAWMTRLASAGTMRPMKTGKLMALAWRMSIGPPWKRAGQVLRLRQSKHAGTKITETRTEKETRTQKIGRTSKTLAKNTCPARLTLQTMTA